MQTLSHSQLSTDQLAQVAYLFADEYFGTDAAAFAYEVDKGGSVKGRTACQKTESIGRSKRGAPIRLSTTAEVHITENIKRQAHINMDALAVSIARDLFNSQSIEQEATK